MLLCKRPLEKIVQIFNALVICLCANGWLLITEVSGWLFLPLPFLVIGANWLPAWSQAMYPSTKVHVCHHGVKCLELFCITVIFSIVFQITIAFYLLPFRLGTWLLSILLCVIVEGILFWNGIICVYTTSSQLKIGLRVWGAVLGFVPIVNVILLQRIIKVAGAECALETYRCELDHNRREQQVCKTKYPLLMVHGVFFRDYNFFNYWGRIPAALEKNGATVFYGEHHSAASVADCGLELAERIRAIVAQTGCEKVNIIAHSKGGLDCRYAIAHTGVGKHVASLTTVNTPHRGCLFADYLLEQIPEGVQNTVAAAYNGAMQQFGDEDPDFLAAVRNLTSEYCIPYDANTPVPEGIYCQSIGS